MDFVQAYNKCEVGEFMTHPNTANPTAGDIALAKNATDDVRVMMGKAVQTAGMKDEELTDDLWNVRKIDIFSEAQILGCQFSANGVSEFGETTFDIIISVKVPDATYAKYVLDTTDATLKEERLTYYI